jgi:nuclear transport factor 2 (NTF2) superfamily protein
MVKNGYTPDSIWRNRDTFLRGHDEIVEFLQRKWAVENGYRLRKELFAFVDNKVCYAMLLRVDTIQYIDIDIDTGGFRADVLMI